MSANPSSRWFWNDWDNDRGLALCSFAAQGLWMRILSIAARAGGYVRVNEMACSPKDIAVLIGHPVAEVEMLIAELEQRHVFSRTRNGTIYNRRMIRDEKSRRLSRKNGKMGGNPNLCKTTKISSQDKGKPTQPLSGQLSAPPFPLNPLPFTQERKTDSEAIASGADAPPGDPVKVIFDLGVQVLGASSRSMIGKARKAYGDVVVLEALIATRDGAPSQPVEFFIGCLKQRGKANGHKRSPVEKLYAGAAAAADAWERRAGNRGDDLPPAIPFLDRR